MSESLIRSGTTSAALAALLATPGAWAAEPAYPLRPIRVVVPYSPGGTTDVLSRLIGLHMSQAWNQQVVIDNRSGGGATIGSDIVAKAPADGHTLLFTPGGSHAANPAMYRKLPYDTARDFAAISLIAWVTNAIVTHPNSSFNSLQDVVNAARAAPGKLTYGSSGNGTIPHLTGELFRSIAKLDMVHVPYKGGGPAMAAQMANETHLMFGALPSTSTFIRSQRLKALAVTGPKRASAFPDIPTVGEAGMPGLTVREWYGYLAPAGTPATVIERIGREVNRIIRIADVETRMNELGAEPVGTDPKTFHQQVIEDIRTWAPIIKSAGIRVD